MRHLSRWLMLSALSASITASAGALPLSPEAVACEAAIQAADEALATQAAVIESLQLELLLAQRKVAMLEAHAVELAAVHERETAALRREIRGQRWRRLLDATVAAGVGFSVGVVSEND